MDGRRARGLTGAGGQVHRARGEHRRPIEQRPQPLTVILGRRAVMTGTDQHLHSRWALRTQQVIHIRFAVARAGHGLCVMISPEGERGSAVRVHRYAAARSRGWDGLPALRLRVKRRVSGSAYHASTMKDEAISVAIAGSTLW